jgi:hypothetical protein
MGVKAKFRAVLLGLLLAAASAPALAADPLVLFLLRMLRDQITMAAAEAAWNAVTRPAPPAYRYLAPPAVAAVPEPEDQRLRTLIDQSFTYLTEPQRDQVHAGLIKILADPQNRALRPQIVESFTRTAQAVRSAQQALQGLNPEEKRSLVRQAREEFLRLAPQERQQMLEILRSGQVPLPQDLTEMMLAEFSAAAPADVARRLD